MRGKDIRHGRGSGCEWTDCLYFFDLFLELPVLGLVFGIFCASGDARSIRFGSLSGRGLCGVEGGMGGGMGGTRGGLTGHGGSKEGEGRKGVNEGGISNYCTIPRFCHSTPARMIAFRFRPGYVLHAFYKSSPPRTQRHSQGSRRLCYLQRSSGIREICAPWNPRISIQKIAISLFRAASISETQRRFRAFGNEISSKDTVQE